MKFIEKIQTIERIDQLIRLRATGTPSELASRLKISRSTVYEIIDCMKQMGAEISYCKRNGCFFYEQEKTLAIGFVKRSKLRGGNASTYNFASGFFGHLPNIFKSNHDLGIFSKPYS